MMFNVVAVQESLLIAMLTIALPGFWGLPPYGFSSGCCSSTVGVRASQFFVAPS